MSGFIVIYNKNKVPVDKPLLTKLTETLKMRGPDGQQIKIDGHVGLGHALFKTTFEAEYENQPATVDGKIWIVGSMRVDDREHLVAKMGLKREINLHTTPDSELILHAYKKWEEACLEHLLGDFAFVIWDSRTDKLFIGTDIFAKKKLYYAETKQSFVVSNNIYTLLNFPGISKEPSDKAIAAFLLVGGSEWIDKSITTFKDISALPPAYMLTMHKNRIDIDRYWIPATGYPVLRYKNDEEYIEHFLDIFQTAVSDRIRTDAVTVAMSGGMDSTSIAAILAEGQKKSSSDFRIQLMTKIIKTQNFESTEYPYAKKVADYLSLPLRTETSQGEFLKMDFSTIQPITVLTPNAVFQATRQYEKKYGRVFFSGNGSDELFTSSSLWEGMKNDPFVEVVKGFSQHWKRHGQRPPLGIRSALGMNVRSQQKASDLFEWLSPKMKAELNIEKMISLIYKTEKLHKNQRHLNAVRALINPSWNTEGVYLDPNFSLAEYRDPFLDRRLINFVTSLPELGWTFDKYLLRRAMKGKLPNAVLERKKQPAYGILEAHFEEKENQWIHQWRPSSLLEPYVDIGAVEKSTELFNSRSKAFINLRMYFLENWLQQMGASSV